MMKGSAECPTIGERLRALREAKQLSLRELGQLTGIHFTALGRKERGETRVSLDERRVLSAALGVPVSELMCDSGTPTVDGIPVVNATPGGVVQTYETAHYDKYGTAFEYLERGDIGDPDAFAVAIVEESMVPEFRVGDRLIFVPARRGEEVRAGAVVAVRLTEESGRPGIVIGRYRPQVDGSAVLTKDNPAFGPLALPVAHVESISMLVEMRRDY